ncbi:TonB family protein [Silvibacterium bohemicum]|uniref:TonB family protein n=1 Tax=Silvibacterium bohemicum TaxID=1577686 RepID=A0A841JUI5_9BACT|nr:TonB family protein [Silvibacterium bohemicum]MBB6142088.1 TonB family protein [Silvibacterium bohemicum]
MANEENHQIEEQAKPVTGSHAAAGPWISFAAHAGLLALLILGGHHAWKVRPASSRGGHPAVLLYWKDGMGTGAVQMHVTGKLNVSPAKKKTETTPLARKKEPALIEAKTKDGQVQASQAGSSNSNSQSQISGAGTSSQDLNPAFPVYSPNPPVRDRGLLPNEETNVVVDVNVSAQGEVLDEKLVRGLGNSIDQAILDTVRGWKFHPATLDGSPVASVSELVFPMSQRYQG